MILRYACVLIFLIATGAAAQEATPEATPDTEQRPACGTCHLDVVAAWLNTPHQLAYENDAFQQAWAAQGQTTDCLTCHVTGLTRRTRTYEYASVSCTACHGETPLSHPDEPVPSIPDVDTCADCHPTTINEWEHSAHSETLTCTDCHSIHPHGLIAEDSETLCLSCHTDPQTSYVHTSHSEADTTCVDCHYHRETIAPEHFVSGALLPTGHANQVMPVACLDCHEALEPDWQTLLVTNISPPVTVPPPTPVQEQIPLTQLMMGLALGAGLGVILAALFFARRRL